MTLTVNKNPEQGVIADVNDTGDKFIASFNNAEVKFIVSNNNIDSTVVYRRCLLHKWTANRRCRLHQLPISPRKNLKRPQKEAQGRGPEKYGEHEKISFQTSFYTDPALVFLYRPCIRLFFYRTLSMR